MSFFHLVKKTVLIGFQTQTKRKEALLRKLNFLNQASGGGEETASDRRWVKSSFV
jgi:hypothetical protein